MNHMNNDVQTIDVYVNWTIRPYSFGLVTELLHGINIKEV